MLRYGAASLGNPWFGVVGYDMARYGGLGKLSRPFFFVVLFVACDKREEGGVTFHK